MTVSSTHQMNVFLVCVAAGAICGMFFDLQRSLRRIYGAGNLHAAFQDILFVLICASAAIGSGFYFNNGEMRYYQILGSLCGAFLYAMILSRYVISAFCCIHKMFIKAVIIPLIKFIRLIFVPIRHFYRFLSKKTRKMYLKIRRLRKIRKSNKKILKKRIKML